LLNILKYRISSEYTAAMPLDVAAEVVWNRPLSDDYNVLALAAPAIAADASPGQFVMIKAGVGFDPLLRRPFSVFEILRDAGGTPTGLTILSKRIGPSTRLIYDAQPGQRLSCLGPLGRPFTLIDPPASAWMVAGGVGLAPFATLTQSLRARGVTCTLFYGARRSAELFYLDFFRALGVDLVLTTEDGSAGERGRVVAPLDRMLASRAGADAVMLYACGPEGMLAATAKTSARYGRPCQVSVERIMGCGLGGCYSCVVPMRDEHGGFHHVRSCLSGPVLAADQILWEQPSRGM
jgi:dihydroorotate dehydrogenase electron transfer subunit